MARPGVGSNTAGRRPGTGTRPDDHNRAGRDAGERNRLLAAVLVDRRRIGGERLLPAGIFARWERN